MKELNRPELVASSISVINGLGYIGSGIIGQLGGWILGRHHGGAAVTASGVVYPPEAYLTLCGFLAALAVVNVIFVCLVPETRSKTLAPTEAPTTPIAGSMP
jgi:hypothetical protein